jgi:carbonic anhydrase/acetyltransferase-like protein (isoleucine patch superfamily)
VFVHASATIIGDVEIDDEASIWPGVVIRGDVNSIRIGARSNVQDGSILHVTHKSARNPAGAALNIGRDVTIGHAVILHGCRIHDECLIGMGSLVMDNAILEPRVLLGAGSLVPEGRVLESGWLYLGRPARQVRRLSEEELAYFAYQAANYARLAAEYRQG